MNAISRETNLSKITRTKSALLLSAGALPSLVALLKFGDHELQEAAVGMVGMVQLSFGSQRNRSAIVSAGVHLRTANKFWL